MSALDQAAPHPMTVNRVLALYVTLLAGFWGGHKFLLGARREGWIYFSLCWSGLPAIASVADFVHLYRQPAIGEGFLRRRISARHPMHRDVVAANTYRMLIALGVMFMVVLLAVAIASWR